MSSHEVAGAAISTMRRQTMLCPGMAVFVLAAFALAMTLNGCGGSAPAATSPSPPVANAGGPYTGSPGVAVSFNGSASTDPQNETLTYAWSFGDGANGTGATPTHAYASAGTYTVSLTVTDTSNLSSTAMTMATITAVTTPTVVTGQVVTCNSDFYSNSTIPAVCYSANLAGCPNASNLNFTYSYDIPASPVGTIVFFPGGKGTNANGDQTFAGYYFGLGYGIVQLEWADDWELTTILAQYTGGGSTATYTANIQVAACREATFLNFVFNTNNTTLYNGGGRCAQGESAGSAAIAYAMAFYGAGNYLDAVELKSGPPLADIGQGCEVPNAPAVTVCGQNNGQQVGCQLGGTSPWTLSPTYDQQAIQVQSWTNDTSCAGSATTSAASNQAWLQQSIVNDGTNNPVYSYPKTAMTAWLCQTIYQQNLCTGGNQYGQGGTPINSCPNNSTSQGQIYYAKLTSDPNNPPQSHYAIYAVQNCDGAEEVNGPDATVAALGGISGTSAIEYDMVTYCPKKPQ